MYCLKSLGGQIIENKKWRHNLQDLWISIWENSFSHNTFVKSTVLGPIDLKILMNELTSPSPKPKSQRSLMTWTVYKIYGPPIPSHPYFFIMKPYSLISLTFKNLFQCDLRNLLCYAHLARFAVCTQKSTIKRSRIC